MSLQVRWFGVSVLLFALLAGSTPSGVLGGGKGKDKKTEVSAVDALGLAAKMEDYGKATKSPAALLAAAELYWSIVPSSVTELKDVDVKIEDANGEKPEPAPKPEDPRDVANALFKLAQDYAKPNEKPGVDELIKGIKGTLGSMKGPHWFTMNIAGKSKQDLSIQFQGKQTAQLSFRCLNGVPLNIIVKGPGVSAQDFCINGGATWFPPTKGAVHVHVHNPHKQAVNYHIWVN